jgi:phage shock protein A
MDRKGSQPMATFEERLAAIENEYAELKQEHASLKHENDDLKQKIELHTIAIGGLVNKAMLERINEKNDKIFQALQNHDQFTNTQLAELREKVEVQVEGRITGLQTEVRQGFERQDKQIADLRGEMNARFDQIMFALAALAPKPDQEA